MRLEDQPDAKNEPVMMQVEIPQYKGIQGKQMPQDEQDALTFEDVAKLGYGQNWPVALQNVVDRLDFAGVDDPKVRDRIVQAGYDEGLIYGFCVEPRR